MAGCRRSAFRIGWRRKCNAQTFEKILHSTELNLYQVRNKPAPRLLTSVSLPTNKRDTRRIALNAARARSRRCISSSGLCQRFTFHASSLTALRHQNREAVLFTREGVVHVHPCSSNRVYVPKNARRARTNVAAEGKRASCSRSCLRWRRAQRQSRHRGPPAEARREPNILKRAGGCRFGYGTDGRPLVQQGSVKNGEKWCACRWLC